MEHVFRRCSRCQESCSWLLWKMWGTITLNSYASPMFLISLDSLLTKNVPQLFAFLHMELSVILFMSTCEWPRLNALIRCTSFIKPWLRCLVLLTCERAICWWHYRTIVDPRGKGISWMIGRIYFMHWVEELAFCMTRIVGRPQWPISKRLLGRRLVWRMWSGPLVCSNLGGLLFNTL
jgi:hypothetical protein